MLVPCKGLNLFLPQGAFSSVQEINIKLNCDKQWGTVAWCQDIVYHREICLGQENQGMLFWERIIEVRYEGWIGVN